MGQLAGKVVIVTGASSGIGRSAAKLFAAEGAGVVVSARREGALDELVGEIERAGGRAAAVAGDVSDEDCAARAVALAHERFGGLDGAFNNAGIVGEMASAPDISLEGWRETLNTNLTGAFVSAKHQLPAMVANGGGSLVFTGSFVGATAGFPGMAAYAASKAGLIGLTQVVAAEFGERGVRANTLIAGGADTPMAAAVANTEEMRRFVEGLYPLKRIAAPEEIARAALFLLSDAASFVTGSAMRVDGGVSIARG